MLYYKKMPSRSRKLSTKNRRNSSKTLKRNSRKSLKRNTRKTLKRNTRKTKRSRRVNRRRNMRGGVRQSLRILQGHGAHNYNEQSFLELMDTFPPDAIVLLGQTSAILSNSALSGKISSYVGKIPIYVGAYNLNRYAQKPGGYEAIVENIYGNFTFNHGNGLLESINLEAIAAAGMLGVFFDICVGGTLTDSRDRGGIREVMEKIWWPLQNLVNDTPAEVKYCDNLGQMFSLEDLNTGSPTDVYSGSSYRSSDENHTEPIEIHPFTLEQIQANINEILSINDVRRKAFMTGLGSGISSNLRTVKVLLEGTDKLRKWEVDSYSTGQMIHTNVFVNELVSNGGGMVYFSDPGRSARVPLSNEVQENVTEFHKKLNYQFEPPVTKLIDLYAGVQLVTTMMEGVETRGAYRGQLRVPDIKNTIDKIKEIYEEISVHGVENALLKYVEEVMRHGGPPFKNIFIQTDCLHKQTEPDDFFAIYLISLICDNLILSFDSYELGDLFASRLIEHLPNMRINAVWFQESKTGDTGYYIAHLVKVS